MDLTIEQWKRRALRAEGAMFHALWMRPLAYQGETAGQMTDRFRQHIESTYPDLITRYEHQPAEVYQWAELCGCPDDGSQEYEVDHSETDGDTDQPICLRTLLGRICGSCEDGEGDGPDWLPDRVLWPCPPIVELNTLTSVSVLTSKES